MNQFRVDRCEICCGSLHRDENSLVSFFFIPAGTTRSQPICFAGERTSGYPARRIRKWSHRRDKVRATSTMCFSRGSFLHGETKFLRISPNAEASKNLPCFSFLSRRYGQFAREKRENVENACATCSRYALYLHHWIPIVIYQVTFIQSGLRHSYRNVIIIRCFIIFLYHSSQTTRAT